MVEPVETSGDICIMTFTPSAYLSQRSRGASRSAPTKTNISKMSRFARHDMIGYDSPVSCCGKGAGAVLLLDMMILLHFR